tara:strand:+ start:2394 stop:2804 length:411 start_codon:yes stop_codon:yes gene_type:complete
MHYKDRYLDRILKKKKLQVGFEMPNYKYQVVDSIYISKKQKKHIYNKLDSIEKNKWDTSKSYAVELFNWNLDIDKFKRPDGAIGDVPVLVDKETESNGTTLYAIIRRSKITTIMMVKPYGPSVESKCKVNTIITQL